MKLTRAFFLGILALISCGQGDNLKPKTANSETINSVRDYEYLDSLGNSLMIKNSLPKSRINYTAPNGAKYIYAVFWTQIINKTTNPIELNLSFPSDSFEFPLSSKNYMKILLPSDTMTLDKASLPEYGLNVKSFLDAGFNKSNSLKRTIQPKDSSAFYVVTISNGGAGGSLRSALSLKEQNLFYKLSLFNNSNNELVLMDKKEIDCGNVSLKGLRLRK